VHYLSDAQLGSLARELDALYADVKGRVGADDAARLEAMIALDRRLVEGGMALLGSRDPREILDGALLLALHVQCEFGELGHPALHGAFDDLVGFEDYHADRYVWSSAMDMGDWKTMHNIGHHVHTNIEGEDHDLGYSMARMNPRQRLRPFHRVQTIYFPLLMAAGPLMASVFTAGSAAAYRGEHILGAAARRSIGRGMRRHLAFMGGALRRGLAGQGSGSVLRAVVGATVASCGGHMQLLAHLLTNHHTRAAHVHEGGVEESRGLFYLRQLVSTDNLVGLELPGLLRRALDRVDGLGVEVEDFSPFIATIDKHIEHHLFPDLPPGRLREVAPEVRAICRAHGVPYRERRLSHAVGEVFVDALLKSPFRRAPLAAPVDVSSWVDQDTRHPLEVLAIEDDLQALVRRLTLALPERWEQHRWPAGAYVTFEVQTAEGPLRRPYSLLHPNRGDGSCAIAVRLVPDGRATTALHGLCVGDELVAIGPPASSFGLVPRTRRSLFIAGGIGITPLLCMLREVRHQADHQATLLYFNRHARGVPLRDELEQLVGDGRRLRLRCCDTGEVGHLDSNLLDAQLAPTRLEQIEQVYLCGPRPLMDAARDLLLARGLDAAQLHEESFGLGPSAELDLPQGPHRLRFARSARELVIDAPITLLEAAEQLGVAVTTGCRSGVCKSCVTRRLDGDAVDATGRPLTSDQLLPCCSYAASDLVLDL
jgi:ferredoxin-NADP reductase/fatty acid desaturase